jgi:guanylate kinase
MGIIGLGFIITIYFCCLFSLLTANILSRLHSSKVLRNMTEIIPIVFAGPSGVGKGTIVNKLIDENPNLFGFSVSHTTRDPRPGEVNGTHYNFVTKDEFENSITNKEFIEYAHVHTNYYGTSFAAVEKVGNQGKVCFLDIDIQGVENVKKSGIKCKYIFISPPTMMELERRLRDRGTETEDKVLVRLSNAAKEMEYGMTPNNFDVIVTNDNLDKTITEIKTHIKSWFPSLDLK